LGSRAAAKRDKTWILRQLPSGAFDTAFPEAALIGANKKPLPGSGFFYSCEG